MAYLEKVGRSQGASIFWGLVSVFFAAAACFYFWKDHENETSANVLRDQVLTLQEQRETLNSQKDKLQASINETESQLKTREEFLQDKEANLAAEESQIEAQGRQTQDQSQQTQAQAAVVKKFNEAVRKLVKDDDTDVVERQGRPVLRVPDSVLFAYGETTLKPEGRALLDQIATALNGRLDGFELRIATFTDSDGEDFGAPDSKPATASPPATAAAPAKGHLGPDWVLTGIRAAAIAHYLREETALPFQNVIVMPRADFQPIIPSGKEAHARNRRIEITIAPTPPTFRPPGSLSGDTTADDPVSKHSEGTAATEATAKTKTKEKTAE